MTTSSTSSKNETLGWDVSGPRMEGLGPKIDRRVLKFEGLEPMIEGGGPRKDGWGPRIEGLRSRMVYERKSALGL
ncbi:hypothetical protein LIER_43805 [Lithospermum erythrorhizon]|uniref:Uncharacterized protein n=1 Tax=Lithospermum erythrorhizon TaxID=34254 RepID=A0AAV3QXM5_LITER